MRTGASLMVIPRSRSKTKESSSCGCILSLAIVPVISKSLSANVDFPWSMWAIIEKLRIFMKKIFIFPFWVWVYGILAYISAEIVTSSTPIDKIAPSTIIFSFSYYIVQVAIVADIITRKRLSLTGIILIGLIYGFLEEAFYIKNPLPLTLLLALGHSAVTITFPYLLVNFLIPGEKQPFLNKFGYVLTAGYLALLYAAMVFFIPFAYPDSLIVSIVALPVLFLLLKKFGKSGISAAISTIKKWEGVAVLILAVFLTIISVQNYLGVMVIFIWLLLRQKAFSRQDLYLISIFFLVFHFLASFLNKSADPAKLWLNYPISFIIGLGLIFFLIRRRFLQ